MTGQQVADLFEQLDVLRRGHFLLSSGKHSDTYLQCALALAQPTVALRLGAALAARVSEDITDIDAVVSPALGGILAGFAVATALDRRFVFTERGTDGAMTLRRGQHVAGGERVLIVEDVVTTGGSALEAAAVCEDAGAKVVGVAALVDRSAGLPRAERPPVPPTALLAVHAQVWEPAACPACAARTPLDSPGSRHAR